MQVKHLPDPRERRNISLAESLEQFVKSGLAKCGQPLRAVEGHNQCLPLALLNMFPDKEQQVKDTFFAE